MNHKVRAAIREYNMLAQGDRVYVALSGGADSVALLYALQCLRGELGISLCALHLNHLLRGEESMRDERFVRALCKRWKIPLIVQRVPVGRLAEKKGLSVELCARRVRYRFFARHASGAGQKLATGHTRSDTVETMLLNLIRGTGLKGLCGVPPVRDNIVRPLIHCTRQEVEAYCASHRLPYVTDSSNLEDDYTRNRIRHQIVPLLQRENSRFETLTGELACQLRLDAVYLEQQAQQAAAELQLDAQQWAREGYLRLHPALQPRVLALLLLHRGLERNRERLELLHQTIKRGSGGMQLSKQWALYVTKDSFVLQKPREKSHRQAPVGGGAVAIVLPGKGENCEIPLECGRIMRLSSTDYENYKKTINNDEKLLKNTLDCDRIEKIVNLKTPKPSDKIRPLGRGCTKSMKHLWAESGIAPAVRRMQRALESGGKLVWTQQCGCDESVAPKDGTKTILVVEIT